MKCKALRVAGPLLLLACSAGAQDVTFTQDLSLAPEWVENQEVAQAQGTTGGQVRIMRRSAPPGDVVFSAHTAMGPWWKNSEIANEVHLTDQQRKEIEQSFYQYRMQLIDATASVQKLDTRLDALMNSEYLEEGEINQVLDQLVQARGSLSKMYAGMLISIRKVLLPEQWKKLQQLQAEKGVMPMMFGAGPMMVPGVAGTPGAFIRRLPPPPPPQQNPQ